MNRSLIVLVGSSASGKSTVEKMLSQREGYKKAISYTTRPMRDGEVDGVDYHFINASTFKEKMENGSFAEMTKYNGWYYGVTKKELENSDRPVIIVVEPHGFRQLKTLEDFNLITFFLKVNWKTQLRRMLDRGDDNMMEIFRRVISDQGTFQGMEQEADFIIDGDRDIEDVYSEILVKIKLGQFVTLHNRRVSTAEGKGV